MGLTWSWISDLAARRAALTPEKQAVYDRVADRWYTYGELNRRANRLANYLKDGLNLAPGDRVAVLARNRIECFDLFFATQKLNVIDFPLNIRLSAAEMDEMLARIEPKALFFEAELEEKAASLRFPFPAKIRLDGAKPAAPALLEAPDYPAVLAPASERPPQAEPFSWEETHLLLSTGGTTGLPKAAMIPHRMVFVNIVNEVLSWNITNQDSAVIILPLFHTGGWHLLTLPILAAGGRIFIDRLFDPEWVLATVARERTTLLFGAATMFLMFAESSAFSKTDLSSLRMAMAGAAPCPKEIMELYWDRGVPFVKGYGLTEAGPNNVSMLWEQMDMVRKKWASVGVPFLYTPMRLLDDRGEDVPAGEVGEICFAGPQIFTGYWRNEKATAETLIDGWVHTGDLGRVDEDGFVYIVDRKKDMFISGGENVYPAEIEAVLVTHPQIREAAVVGVPDPKWGEVGKAFVVLQAPGLRPEEIIRYCRTQLAGYKVPKYVEILDSLPKSSVGKVVKVELKELARGGGQS
ncbi:MAG: AMP-binding protein [Bacillota bacterium]